MFMYTIQGATVRFLGVMALVVCLLLGVVVLADSGVTGDALPEAVETIRYSGIKSDEDRISFLKSLGWETTGEVVEEKTFTLPETFDRVLLGYNEIQKNQGLDLSRYRKKKVTRYTYEITNYPGVEGTVYANLIVYRGKIVAGDICSKDPMGFVEGLEKTT